MQRSQREAGELWGAVEVEGELRGREGCWSSWMAELLLECFVAVIVVLCCVLMPALQGPWVVHARCCQVVAEVLKLGWGLSG
jgi:hypothetical protein